MHHYFHRNWYVWNDETESFVHSNAVMRTHRNNAAGASLAVNAAAVSSCALPYSLP